jgi:parallel beta-helix repeat protein
MNLYKNAVSVAALATGAVLLSLTSPRTVHALGEQVICGLSTPGSAVDGVKLIDHAQVLRRGGYPYQIKEAGSYRLSGNLVVSAGANAINITVSNVTLDLNGFTISGPGSSAISGASTPISAVSVRNKTISGLNSGVDLGNCTGCSIQQMIIENGPNGINVGPGARVSSNLITGVTQGFVLGNGIVAGVNSTIVGNTVTASTFGIQAASSSTVSGNTVSNSYSVAINVGIYSTASGNTATNSNTGILVSCPANLLGNTALANAFGNISYNSGSGCNSVNNLAP